MQALLEVLDLVGTFVFGLSGAAAGVRKRLDLFGVLVLAFIVGVAGGVIAQTLTGLTPPVAMRDWRYLAVTSTAGLLTFRFYATVDRLRNPVLLFDAAGLALFVVSGTRRALMAGLGPFSSALFGMLSGIGGGIVRDVLLAEIPSVLRTDIYALAALAGSTLVVAAQVAGLPAELGAITGAAACFGLRYMAIHHGWRLPTARPPVG